MVVVAVYVVKWKNEESNGNGELHLRESAKREIPSAAYLLRELPKQRAEKRHSLDKKEIEGAIEALTRRRLQGLIGRNCEIKRHTVLVVSVTICYRLLETTSRNYYGLNGTKLHNSPAEGPVVGATVGPRKHRWMANFELAITSSQCV